MLKACAKTDSLKNAKNRQMIANIWAFMCIDFAGIFYKNILQRGVIPLSVNYRYVNLCQPLQ